MTDGLTIGITGSDRIELLYEGEPFFDIWKRKVEEMENRIRKLEERL